jgi:hypothetical protein
MRGTQRAVAQGVATHGTRNGGQRIKDVGWNPRELGDMGLRFKNSANFSYFNIVQSVVGKSRWW